MESSIITILSQEKNKMMKLEEITKELKVQDTTKLLAVIKNLEETGIIFRDKKGRYTLITNTNLKRGLIKITKKKGPIVIFEDKTETVVTYKDHKTLENNDIVLVDISNNIAKVVKIIRREHHNFIAEVIKDEHGYKAVSNGYESIILDEIYPLGTKLLIDGKTLEVKEVLGHKDDVGTKEKEVLAEYNFPISFNEEYLKEVNSIEKSLSEEVIDMEKRNGLKDQRSITSVTIDGDDTKDFDDAVAFHNNTVYVQIVDPNRYIKDNSAMWDETLRRAISTYFPGCCNPMMHEILSNGICSLVPGEDRYAISMSIKIDDSGKVLNYKINEAVINNRKRMTYTEVNKYLEENTIPNGYENYTELLDNLYKTAMKVKRKMINEGFLEFTSDEVKFFFESSKLIDIRERHQGKAEELIEFLMLLHNMCMTDYFLKNKLPFISRFHDSPNTDKLNTWMGLLKKKGYRVYSDKKKSFTTEDIKKIQKLYADSKEKIIFDKMAIMSQAKAKYSAYDIGHYALGMGAYSTSTSPIRRLSDTINQRIFKDSLHYGVDYARKKWSSITPYIAKIATDAELRAVKAEHRLDDIRKAEFMKQYEKQDFEVIVSDIKENFIIVLYPERMVYGKLFYNSRYFHLGKDGYSIMGHNGEKIMIGDIFNARLTKVNVLNGEVVFSKGISEINEINHTENNRKRKVRRK